MKTNRRRSLRDRLFGSSSKSKWNRTSNRKLITEPLESRVLLAGDLNYYNSLLPSDVTRDGWSTSRDVLVIINELNSAGSRSLAGESAAGETGAVSPATRQYAFDVTGDNFISPLDALAAINRINGGEGQGESYAMNYILRAVDADNNPVTEVFVGDSFQLVAQVQDVRATSPGTFGVMAGYLDVRYDPSIADSPSKTITHTDPYSNLKLGTIAVTSPGTAIIDGAGGFTGASGLEQNTLYSLWKVDFVAQSAGVVTFTGEPTTQNPNDLNDPFGSDSDDLSQHPGRDTLLYGVDIPVCPAGGGTCFGSMGFVNASVTVKAEFEAVNDAITVTEDSSVNRVSVLNNDILNKGGPKQINSFTGGAHGQVAKSDNGTPADPSDDVLLYTPASNYFGADTFTYTASNGKVASTATVTVTVSGVNDRPIVSVTGSPQLTTAEDTPLSIVITASDSDADASGGVQATISAGQGVLKTASSAAGITGDNTGSVTIVGLVADVNAALSGIRYTPTPNFNGSDSLLVLVNDLGHTGSGGQLTASASAAITVTAVNDPPVNNLPAIPQITDEETSLVLSTANGNAISISDVDAGGSAITTSISLPAGSAGSLQLGAQKGLSIQLSGTLAAINSALAGGLAYTPADLFVGSENLTVTTTSQGQTDTDVLVLEVAPKLRPRAITDSVTMNEDAGPIVMDVLANDRPHVGSEAILLSFTSASHGIVLLNDNATPSDRTDDTLSYTPNQNYNGSDSFTYSINDTDGTGANSTATVAISVNAVNDAPTLKVPGLQQIDEDTVLNFGAGDFSVNDVDTANGNVVVTLAATQSLGKIGVAAAPDSNIEGSGTSSVRFTGTLGQVNLWLQGIKLTPNAFTSGTEVLSVTVNDLGNVGSGGVLSMTSTVPIEIAAVNNAPVNTVPGDPALFVTNFDNYFSAATGNAIQVSDVDAGSNAINVTLTVTGGTFTVSNKVLVSIAGDGSSSVLLQGSQQNINQTLKDGIVYRNSVVGDYQVTVTTSDLGFTGTGGTKTDSDTVGIQVVDFVPSTVGGRVITWGDKDKDKSIDANEVGFGLADVKIQLEGTDKWGQTVTETSFTDKNGLYSFKNIRPGTYQLRETQPFGILDGVEAFDSNDVATLGNDLGQIEIPIRGGVDTQDNIFTELGLEPQYISGFRLTASSHSESLSSEIVLTASGANDWHSITGAGWAGYEKAKFVMNAGGQSGILTVLETATGKLKQATVTLASSRLRPSSDGKVITIIGGATNFAFTDAPSGEGEGSSWSYRQGADALFGQLGNG